MKIAAVIPMKMNNSRLPNKNIKSFTNGDALCTYILKTLSEVKDIEETYVYCSDESIKDHIPANVKFLKRSKEYDQDSTKMNEILKAFSEEVDADIYLMTHTTAPFISAKSIQRGIDAIFDGYDSSFSVKKIQDFLWKDNKSLNYSLDNIPRTQDLEPIFCETSGFYIYKKEIIQKYNRRIGFNPCLIEVSEIESCDIDEYEDFYIADAIFNYQKLKSQK